MLSTTTFRAPDFDRARDTHPKFGEPLMVLYMVLGAVILVNMLVAFFNQSYSDVVAKAREEHLLHFSIKVCVIYGICESYPFDEYFDNRFCPFTNGRMTIRSHRLSIFLMSLSSLSLASFAQGKSIRPQKVSFGTSCCSRFTLRLRYTKSSMCCGKHGEERGM